MDKKSILIGALGAALLFVTLGATYPEQEPKGIWELHDSVGDMHSIYTINTVTGEVRYHHAWNNDKILKQFEHKVSKAYTGNN